MIALLILFTSCNSKQTEQHQIQADDTTKKNVTAVDKFEPQNYSNSKITTLKNRRELVGIWRDEGKEVLTVKITNDSIYYTEHYESHKYNLKRDSIFIIYPDFIYAAKVYFDKDTLMMKSDDGILKFIRLNK